MDPKNRFCVIFRATRCYLRNLRLGISYWSQLVSIPFCLYQSFARKMTQNHF